MTRVYHYIPGTVRWFRWTGEGDVRGHRPPEGWMASAHLIDWHPVNDKPLGTSQWWIREAYYP